MWFLNLNQKLIYCRLTFFLLGRKFISPQQQVLDFGYFGWSQGSQRRAYLNHLRFWVESVIQLSSCFETVAPASFDEWRVTKDVCVQGFVVRCLRDARLLWLLRQVRCLMVVLPLSTLPRCLLVWFREQLGCRRSSCDIGCLRTSRS